MHEAPHDPETGILGGAWGARSFDAQPPLPDLYAQMGLRRVSFHG